MKPMEFKHLEETCKINHYLTSISLAELQNNFGGPCKRTSARTEMHISHSLSLFAIGIKGIIGFLSLLNDIHIPGIILCLLQQ